MASVTDDSGSTAYRYDVRGNTVWEQRVIGAQIYVTEYSYDLVDRIMQTVYPSGRVVDYARDSIGRITGVTTKASAGATPVMLASGVTYDAMGPLNALTLGNGATLALGRDLNGRLAAIDQFDGATPLLNLDYTHDLAGNITAIADAGGGNRGRNYVYDPLYRLTQAQELASGGSPVTLQSDYTYDTVGNRLTRTAGALAETYAYDAFANQLDTVTTGGATRTLAYGDSGNTATDDDGAGTVLTHNYDSTDRLIEIKQGAATVATYMHNAMGQRVAKTVGAVTTHYIYDQSGQVLAEHDGATSAAQAEYIWLGRVPLAYIASGNIHYVHADHLGTPQLVTDDTAAVVWDADYRPFGEATVSGALTFNWRFPGQYYDDETALHYNGFRDYDPRAGRYIQSDPIGLDGGWNSYAYVSGNPVLKFDSLGTEEATDNLDDPYRAYPVHPFSIRHIYRNQYNKCPSAPPEKDCDEDKWCDSTGREWSQDVDIAGYHGGAVYGLFGGNKTWRSPVTVLGRQSGWQCTYNGNMLVNDNPYQGTFDYWYPGTHFWSHQIWDVDPHKVNPNYAENLTTTY